MKFRILWVLALAVAIGLFSGAKSANGTELQRIPRNNPPNTPAIPSGPTSGFEQEYYTYSTSATDPDGDRVYYWIYLGWTDPVTGQEARSRSYQTYSGRTESASGVFPLAGTYQVRAQACDEHDSCSGLSATLTVVIQQPLACAKLTTNKSQYGAGEKVWIKFENQCGRTLYLVSAAPWEAWWSLFTQNRACTSGDPRNRLAYSPPAFRALTPVAHNGFVTWQWDQRDSSGQPVEMGCYQVQIGHVLNETMDQVLGLRPASFYTDGGRLTPEELF